jgi:hypothetical protein
LSRREATKQEVETFPEGAIPIVIQKQAGAFDGPFQLRGVAAAQSVGQAG